MLVAAAAPKSAAGLKKPAGEKKKPGNIEGMKLVRQNFLRRRGCDEPVRHHYRRRGTGRQRSRSSRCSARHRVLLVEKSRFDRPRFGETAPPELRSGAHARRSRASRDECRSVATRRKCCRFGEVTSPGHGTTSFSPYGHRLHLDRRAFDEALALAARDAGADLRARLCCALVHIQPRGGYVVQLSTGERFRTNAAIIATGRAGGGLGLPYVREYLDNNVAVAARLSSPKGSRDHGRSSKPFREGGSIWLPCQARRLL